MPEYYEPCGCPICINGSQQRTENEFSLCPIPAIMFFGMFMSSRISFWIICSPMHASYVHVLRSVITAHHELFREVALAISNAAQIQKDSAQLHFAPMRYVLE